MQSLMIRSMQEKTKQISDIYIASILTTSFVSLLFIFIRLTKTQISKLRFIICKCQVAAFPVPVAGKFSCIDKRIKTSVVLLFEIKAQPVDCRRINQRLIPYIISLTPKGHFYFLLLNTTMCDSFCVSNFPFFNNSLASSQDI